MGDYTTVVVAQADFCAVSESIHGYPPIRLSELSCQLMAACLYPICTVRKFLARFRVGGYQSAAVPMQSSLC